MAKSELVRLGFFELPEHFAPAPASSAMPTSARAASGEREDDNSLENVVEAIVENLKDVDIMVGPSTWHGLANRS